MVAASDLRFAVQDAGEVTALFLRPVAARWLLVLAHGAGAGMSHSFLETLAGELAAAGVATFRYQFPYMEERRRFPDRPAVLTAAVRAAVDSGNDNGSGPTTTGRWQVVRRTNDFTRCGSATT